MTNPPTDPRAKARSRWLLVAGALTLAATAWTALRTDDAAPAPPRSRADATAGERAPRARTSAALPAEAWPVAPSTGRRPPWPAAAAPGVAAWGPPASPSAPPAAPAAKTDAAATPPQAPAFPYTLIGRLDDGEPRALLSSPLRSFGVKTADVLDGAWRVDSVDAQGITVTWLPAGLKKTIPFASS